MLIQRLLQLLLIAIVIVVALALLGFVLQIAGTLLWLGVQVLVLLVVVAAVLRFVELWRAKRRW
ncbi:MAG: hypothetical protein ACK41D_06070 [Rubricoccaceae bacterium]